MDNRPEDNIPEENKFAEDLDAEAVGGSDEREADVKNGQGAAEQSPYGQSAAEQSPYNQGADANSQYGQSPYAGNPYGQSPYSQQYPVGAGGSPYDFRIPPSHRVAPAEKKGISISSLIILLVVTAVVTYQITSLGYNAYYGGKSNSDIPEYYSSALTISEYLDTYYIGKLDEKVLRDALAAAVLYAAGDAYAYYYTAEEYAEEMMNYGGGAVGIGVRVIYTEEPGGLEILRVMVDTPAEKAGLKRGDIVVGVDGNDFSQLTYNEMIGMVQGEIGSSVQIEVLRGDQRMSFTVERNEYVQQTVESHMYKDGATAKKIGVVQVFAFNDSTPSQFKDAVNSLVSEGAEGLVFDMRENPGGSLDSVVEMLDFLLPAGKIVRITDKNGKEVQTYTSDPSSVDLPMAVLTNGNTASAAELFTSALKDYDKAISVGTKSYGKGTMQAMFPLPDGAAFKFSYRYYSPPISENYHGVGISPEIELPLPEGTVIYRLTDADDLQLEAAVNYLVTGETGNAGNGADGGNAAA
ncbi:MAG: PDZ domain-containing protein [Clostridia bacterium]|nr:PDZ domain-containing protein [Clostridia bacterium]